MLISQKRQKGRYTVLQTIQWILFGLLAIVCYLLETSGSCTKPLLLIPLALCIASHTGEIQAAAVGMLCGFLLDLSCGKLIGYNAIWMMLSCVGVSLLYSYLLRHKLVNMLFLTAICALIQGGLDYIFYYAIWGHENVELIFYRVILPSCCMTIASAIVFYFLIHKIAEKCGSHVRHELEKSKLVSYESD